MPITDRSQAKEGGFGQVRAALQKFEGTVQSAEFDEWGGQLVDPDTGQQLPKKEFLEIQCSDVEVLEVTEELSMDVSDYSFRVNCSDYKGSFWVDMFLESADRFKIQIPDGLVGKRLVFEKKTLEANDPKYNSTNYVIAGVQGKPAPKVAKKTQEEPAEEVMIPGSSEDIDYMELLKEIAVGKTDSQLKTAVALHPTFSGSPLLPLAKSGTLVQALLGEGKLVLDENGKYQLPE